MDAKAKFVKAKKVVSLVTDLSHRSSNSSRRSNKQADDDDLNNSQCPTFVRSMSDSGFESKESEKLLIRRGTEVQTTKLNLSQTRRKRFQERVDQQNSSSKQYFRNFTNIFGEKKRRGSKQEKVTLQSIMSRDWTKTGADQS